MRLFIAINLNDKTKGALLDLRDELRSRAQSGSFTLPENLHMTLAFLGECSAKQYAAAKTAMDEVNFESFELIIERVGRFGGRQGEATWWAGARESNALFDLQRVLAGKLEDAGFVTESRRFSPHITIGRRVITDSAPWPIEPFGETVRKIDLMKSERINGKLTYTAIYEKNRGACG